MANRMRAMLVPALLLGLAPAALATDKVYQNDSIGDGSQAAVQAGFVQNEIAASVFTVPAGDGTVFLREAQVLFFNALGLGTTRNVRVLVYASGAVNPGAPIFTSPIFTFLPGGANVVDLSGASLEMAPGQTFTVGLKFEQGNGLDLPSLTSVVTDTNGITANKNRVFAVPGGWVTAESLGITGDFGIRVAVTTKGPVHYGAGTAGTLGVPTIDTTGLWKVGGSTFAISGTKGAASSTAAIGISAAPASLPIQGITLLLDAATLIGFLAPTNASGNWTLPAAIPGDPALAGVHVYAQALHIDLGAPLGVSCSDGLDIEIAAP